MSPLMTTYICPSSDPVRAAGEKVRLAALEHVQSHREGLAALLAEAAALQAEVLPHALRLFMFQHHGCAHIANSACISFLVLVRSAVPCHPLAAGRGTVPRGSCMSLEGTLARV